MSSLSSVLENSRVSPLIAHGLCIMEYNCDFFPKINTGLCIFLQSAYFVCEIWKTFKQAGYHDYYRRKANVMRTKLKKTSFAQVDLIFMNSGHNCFKISFTEPSKTCIMISFWNVAQKTENVQRRYLFLNIFVIYSFIFKPHLNNGRAKPIYFNLSIFYFFVLFSFLSFFQNS